MQTTDDGYAGRLPHLPSSLGLVVSLAATTAAAAAAATNMYAGDC